MIAATKIIYQGWLKLGNPLPYNTSDKDGPKTVMCEFVDPISHQKYDSGWSGICCICGQQTTGAIPSTGILGNTYTDAHRHKAPESTHICEACAFCILLNPAAGRCMLSRYSFVASNDGLWLCNRAEMRDALIHPPEPPFVAVVAVSQKKHLATKATVSYSADRYACMLEEERIDIVRSDFERCIKVIEALRGMGCTKDEIEARNFRFERLKDWGVDNYERAIIATQPFAGSRMFKLALHVAQKTDDMEECKCILDFKLTS